MVLRCNDKQQNTFFLTSHREQSLWALILQKNNGSYYFFFCCISLLFNLPKLYMLLKISHNNVPCGRYLYGINRIHHEYPCRIKKSHPRGEYFCQGRGLPRPWSKYSFQRVRFPYPTWINSWCMIIFLQ